VGLVVGAGSTFGPSIIHTVLSVEVTITAPVAVRAGVEVWLFESEAVCTAQ
jgi:hypothetical protein